MSWMKDMIAAMEDGTTAVDYIHQKRQERATPEGRAFAAALTQASKTRPETMTIQITAPRATKQNAR